VKILITGANGFVGGNVTKEALSAGHEVHTASKGAGRESETNHELNLEDRREIADLLEAVRPDVVINCAGVIDGGDNSELNKRFTANLLEEIIASGQDLQRIVVLGSASEYGIVGHSDAVGENHERITSSRYGQSKKSEVDYALSVRKNQGLPVIVARPFNPIGKNMHPRMLIPNLVRQIEEIKSGKREAIEISRLDSGRDYIDIRDVAGAIVAIATGNPKYEVYNIGTGTSSTNRDIIDLLVEALKLPDKPEITETAADEPDVLVAAKADITRISTDIGWQPKYSLKETIEEIVDAAD